MQKNPSPGFHSELNLGPNRDVSPVSGLIQIQDGTYLRSGREIPWTELWKTRN